MPDKLPGSGTHRSQRCDGNMTMVSMVHTMDMTGSENRCLKPFRNRHQAEVFTSHVRVVHFACPSGYALKNHHQTRPMRPASLFWHQHLDTGTMRQNCRSKHGCLQAFNISRPTQQITSLSTKISVHQSAVAIQMNTAPNHQNCHSAKELLWCCSKRFSSGSTRSTIHASPAPWQLVALPSRAPPRPSAATGNTRIGTGLAGGRPKMAEG